LHPVWLIFALSVFGTMFGFVGLLVAVPVAAMIGVLTRFAIGQYEGSKLYYGHTPPMPDPDPAPDQSDD
jgi:predicted PurR-regulated permease PerM